MISVFWRKRPWSDFVFGCFFVFLHEDSGGEKKRGGRGEVGGGAGLLPHAMPAKGHEVVHAIVRLGHAGEDASNALCLFGLGDGLEAKMCLAIGRGRGRRSIIVRLWWWW